jgi:hypothetical protein
MISLEQIRLLEAKVTKAVELIKSLREENASLRRTLDSAQGRMQELEKLVGEFKADQKEIERGVLRAIESLEELEDEIGEAPLGADGSGENLGPRSEPGEAAPPMEPPSSPEQPPRGASRPRAGRAAGRAEDGAGERPAAPQDHPEEPEDRELDIF